MSLFGDGPEAPSRPKSSLFDDDSAAQSKKSSSMFGDAPDDAASPWGFTPSKKNAGRGSLVRSLLADADVPDLYIDTFDNLQRSGVVIEGDVKRLLRESGIGSGDQDKIWNTVSSHGQSNTLGRPEFNVLLALIGLAQEGEDLSLDAVDERRRKLPTPRLPQQQSQQPPPATPQSQPQSQANPGAQVTPSPHQNGGMGKTSFGAGFGEQDPWASPQMHRGHAHLNGATRTTSSFTTTSAIPESTGNESGAYGNGQSSQTGENTSWGGASGYGPSSGAEGFGSASGAGEGFGGEGGGSGGARRPVVPRNTISKGAEEEVMIQLLEEKEGMFMFQHRNYEVTSVRRNSKVIRRYSDFVWLLDCLHKRYPFRQLPLLPPKRVAINGNHIAADQTFLEKRRRGLARFANALVRHPVLREEQLVVMFLTVPTVDARPFPSNIYPENHC
jgi:sorting nexin-8